LYPDRLPEHVERLAHHALRGEVWEKALTYLRQAGVKVAARSAHRVAVGYFEQALGILVHLPEGGARSEQAIDLRFDLRNSLFPLGEHGRILKELQEAELLAESLDDQRRLGWVSCYMTLSLRMMGDHRQAIESGRRALTLATALGDFALQLETNCYLGQAFFLLGVYPQAMECLGRAVASLEGPLSHERSGLPALPSVFSRTWLAWCHAERGEFTEGIAHAEEALRIAKATDHPYSLCVACYGAGGLYLRKGDLPAAISVLEGGLDLCRTGELPVLLAVTAMHLGYAYALAGRVAEALPLLERAVEHAGSMRMGAWHSVGLAWLGEAYRLAGRPGEARERAEQALDLFRRYGERGYQAWALRILGEIHASGDPGDVPQAEAAYRQAICLAEELGMRPILALCHLGLGVLYRERGRLPEARSELSVAIALFRAMGMTSWLGRGEAGLAQAV
jgi:tetratricopeptide (TPR) repeat protein